MSRNRERDVIAAVPCPVCRAPRGAPCTPKGEAERATWAGRVMAHGPRREAWQAQRRSATHEARVEPGDGCWVGRCAGCGWRGEYTTESRAYDAARRHAENAARAR